MRRKRLIALAVLPALLLAGDFFYWRLAVGHLRAGFESWVIASRSSGWDIRHGEITASGWPDAAALRIENITVAVREAFGHGGITIAGSHLDGVVLGSDEVVLRTGLTRPEIIEVTSVGPHPLLFNGGPLVPIRAENLHLRLALRSNALPRAIDFDGVSLLGDIPGFGEIKVKHLSARAEMKPESGRDQPLITFTLSAQPVTLPERVHWSLGPEIGAFVMEGVLNGSPGTVGQGLAARATSWRDEGGSLELHKLVIRWGDVRIDATATMALDEDLQPMGAGTGKIAGFGAALDVLAANAMLTRSAAKAAKAVLALLATTAIDSQTEEVEVPLTLQFRTLSVRQVPLVRLPELDWPDR